MKTTRLFLLSAILMSTLFVNAQNSKATKWITDKCQKITAKITKDLSLTSEDSVKFNDVIIQKFVYEREAIKQDTPAEVKKEVYKTSMNQFINSIKTSFPGQSAQKIQNWYKENYQNFNSL